MIFIIHVIASRIVRTEELKEGRYPSLTQTMDTR